jgi:hypothetical protein
MAPSSRPSTLNRPSESPSSRSSRGRPRLKHKSRGQRGASVSPSGRTANLVRARRISFQKSRSPSPHRDHNQAQGRPIVQSLAPPCKGWLRREQVVTFAHAHSHSRRSPTGRLDHGKQARLKPKPRTSRENQTMRARELNWRRTPNIAPNEGIFCEECISEPRRGQTTGKIVEIVNKNCCLVSTLIAYILCN